MNSLKLYLVVTILNYYISQNLAQDYHVTDFNATGDGKTDDTKAIRAAMAAATNGNGGRVIFDANYVFLTGAFNVTSNIILDVRGTILASNTSDEFTYPIIPPLPWIGSGVDGNNEAENNVSISSNERQPFIHVYNATNVTLTGGGIIDGQGKPWWACSWEQYITLPPCNNISRPMFVRFTYSSNIIVHDITLKNSISWTLHLAWVTTAHVYNVNFIGPGCVNYPPDVNNSCAHNTDGIDVDCSVGVLIENCYYEGSDDAVTVISGKDYNGRTFGRASQNVFVRNFTVVNSPNSAMSIGSGTSAGIRNITFTDIYFNGTSSGPRMKSSRGRGGAIEDITFNNFYIYNTLEYVGTFTAFYRHSPPTNATGTPKVNNIKITNMYVDGGKRGWDFDWLPESPIRGIYLSNITIKNFNTTDNFWTKCQSVDGYCDHSSVSPSCPPCLNAGCPTDWYQSSVNNNQCYQVDNESLTWTDAQNSCQNSLLTSLTSVDNAFENAEITKYVSQTYPNCQKVYIGLQSNGNTWSWINGDNSTYRNWDTNYPSNNSDAYCAALNLVNGKWTNEACSNPECYICAFVLNE